MKNRTNDKGKGASLNLTPGTRGPWIRKGSPGPVKLLNQESKAEFDMFNENVIMSYINKLI